MVLLLAAAASLSDELAEDSQSCYWPDGGCGAWGVPTLRSVFRISFKNRAGERGGEHSVIDDVAIPASHPVHAGLS